MDPDIANEIPGELNKFVERRFEYSRDIALRREFVGSLLVIAVRVLWRRACKQQR